MGASLQGPAESTDAHGLEGAKGAGTGMNSTVLRQSSLPMLLFKGLGNLSATELSVHGGTRKSYPAGSPEALKVISIFRFECEQGLLVIGGSHNSGDLSRHLICTHVAGRPTASIPMYLARNCEHSSTRIWRGLKPADLEGLACCIFIQD